MANGGRLLFVDALRAFAALWVVLFHVAKGQYVDNLVQAIPNWLGTVIFKWGVLGVPVFFVLSGFVIALSLSRVNVDKKYFLFFTLRRSIRLDPPYWASIILVLGTGCVIALKRGESLDLPSISGLAAHVFYLQDILQYPTISSVYWTLCLEIQFYLVFCALLGLVRWLDQKGMPGRKIVFIPAAIVPLIWVFGIANENIYPGLFFPFWHEFLLGVFAYWAWTKRIPTAVFVTYVLVLLPPSIYIVNDFTITAVITSSLLLFMCKTGRIATALNFRWIQWLGTISYSLYLTHDVFLVVSFFILNMILGRSAWIEAFALPIMLLSCVAGASVFWLLFERPSLKLCRRIPLHKSQQQTTSSEPASADDLALADSGPQLQPSYQPQEAESRTD